MKILLKYISIITTILFLAYSCETDENGPMPDNIQEGCFPYIEVDNSVSSPFINVDDLNGYMMKGEVKVLFDSPYDKLTLAVAYNGNYSDYYVLKDDIVNVPADIEVTTSDLVNTIDELSSASDIKIADEFHVYVIPTIAGKEFPPYQEINDKVYNTVSSSILQNLTALKGLTKADVNITVPCAFDPSIVSGSFYSVSADWSSAGDITIFPDESDPFVVYVDGLETMEGLVEDKGPLKMVIQPNYDVVVERQVIVSSLSPWGLPYTNLAYEGFGTYDTCTGTYTMTFEITVDQGSFGSYNFTFTIQ
ncbi:MAG: hypothetical protein K9G70_02480 [Prolixibacteraceae bacterium]|nr:hypothetical protein [Prolixibacteraceae bacterium]